MPQIAELAGVTPSTIYRRWGNLAELLADVSLERLHLDTAPVDTGSLAGDLQAWCEQYLEEMTSVPGRRGLDDIMASADDERRQRCRECSEAIMQTLRERALARGEVAPPVAVLMDTLIAPLTYHLLYARGEIPPTACAAGSPRP
ncbi:TetR/AcrR family transcriptional regulator [Salinicola tamaricis]|uniref:TetR/AcrR family transcriptional regulator n=1 Tax=Salinicola tamaricis TaxID=1771309 RepID=UPI001F5C857B|nr:TetR/AcrR family transcriptional regulator [Salinicola tamaricis]